MSLPSHHVRGLFGRRFRNPWPTWEERGASHLYSWWLERREKGVSAAGWLTSSRTPSASEFEAALPAAATDWARLAAPPADAVQCTWVGHACALLQLQGVTLLTDPVLGGRCSPLPFAGPLRVVPPGLDLFDERSPRPDAVLISHNHYDHLCVRSVRQLAVRYPGLHFFVPLGLKAWFEARGLGFAAGCRVTELDWWQEARVGPLRLACTPAQHWSSRTPWDKDATLWSSWAVLGERQRVWFGGDTGYCPVFAEIGQRLGPFDLSLIPIGAYEPAWFHSPAHIGPAEAVQVHSDIRSRRSVPIHWGAWSLTDEAMDAPPAVLAAAAVAAGLPRGAFEPLLRGETCSVAAA